MDFRDVIEKEHFRPSVTRVIVDVDLQPTRGMARRLEMDDKFFPFVLLHKLFQTMDVMVGEPNGFLPGLVFRNRFVFSQ